jgi:hypothetical protein
MRHTVMNGCVRISPSTTIRASINLVKQIGRGDDADDLTTAEHEQAADRVAAHPVRRSVHGCLFVNRHHVARHHFADFHRTCAASQAASCEIMRRHDAHAVAGFLHNQVMDTVPAHHRPRIVGRDLWRYRVNVRGHYFGNSHDNNPHSTEKPQQQG